MFMEPEQLVWPYPLKNLTHAGTSVRHWIVIYCFKPLMINKWPRINIPKGGRMQKAANEKRPIEIERTFDTPIAKVWKAISSKDDMKQWYFEIAEFKPEVGFEFQFWGGSDDKKYLHLCRVTEAVTDSKLAYSWRYDEFEGSSLVVFELSAQGEKTKLKFSHEGLETFPKNDPDFARESFAEGWDYIINKSLREFVERA